MDGDLLFSVTSTSSHRHQSPGNEHPLQVSLTTHFHSQHLNISSLRRTIHTVAPGVTHTFIIPHNVHQKDFSVRRLRRRTRGIP